MKITVLSVTIETVPTSKGSYQKAVVAYKNDQGKVEGKNIMSFSNKNVYEAMANAKSGEVYDVDTVKNDKGYWEWTAVVKSSTDAVPATQRVGNAAPKSNYETPEERAQRQVFIIRQSSLSTAVSALSVGSKSAPKAEDILALAKQFEDYVFNGLSKTTAIVNEIVPVGGDMDEEIPF